ncbi:DMT family transporter [Vogesella sp. DC21W]|uniref:DMT family transporter n=1 Tax=Vogesella aquatica TaxID=2984206 RepID=A0ABT5J059_9NEIS|nr:DMT family transporter [Vogesella aquatica]MDC7717783.1 DMT family transporter [Vogesella aquatica]
MSGWFARLGSAWMVVAAASFAGMSMLAAMASQHIGAIEILFYRTAIGLAVLLVPVALGHEGVATVHWPAHFRRSIAGYLSMAMLFYALTRLPLATAVTLNYTSSLSFAVCCVLLRGERLSQRVKLALLLGFVGIVLILRPTFHAGQWLPGLVGLLSGAGAGLALFHVRELGELGERPGVTVFWLYFLSTVCGLAWVMLQGGFTPLGLSDLSALLGVGLLGLLGQLAMTRAYKEGRKFVVSSLAYLTVVFSALLGVVFGGQLLSASAVLGMLMIIGCGMLAAKGS